MANVPVFTGRGEKKPYMILPSVLKILFFKPLEESTPFTTPFCKMPPNPKDAG